jgi:hypothetical protein
MSAFGILASWIVTGLSFWLIYELFKLFGAIFGALGGSGGGGDDDDDNDNDPKKPPVISSVTPDRIAVAPSGIEIEVKGSHLQSASFIFVRQADNRTNVLTAATKNFDKKGKFAIVDLSQLLDRNGGISPGDVFDMYPEKEGFRNNKGALKGAITIQGTSQKEIILTKITYSSIKPSTVSDGHKDYSCYEFVNPVLHGENLNLLGADSLAKFECDNGDGQIFNTQLQSASSSAERKFKYLKGMLKHDQTFSITIEDKSGESWSKDAVLRVVLDGDFAKYIEELRSVLQQYKTGVIAFESSTAEFLEKTKHLLSADAGYFDPPDIDFNLEGYKTLIESLKGFETKCIDIVEEISKLFIDPALAKAYEELIESYGQLHNKRKEIYDSIRESIKELFGV